MENFNFGLSATFGYSAKEKLTIYYLLLKNTEFRKTIPTSTLVDSDYYEFRKMSKEEAYIHMSPLS